MGWYNLRKALDEAVLVCDLASLIYGVLLGTIGCQFYTAVYCIGRDTYAWTCSSDASSLQVI